MNGNKSDIQAMKVLLVEDNPGDEELIREALKMDKDRPVNLHVCGSLTDALKTLESRRFDLLLLDPDLPDSDGEQSVLQLLAAASGIPVIVLTEGDNPAFAIRCIKAGATDYLIKGSVEKHLSLIIYNAVARAAAQKEVMELYENVQRMVEDSPDAMLVLGQDNTIRFANRAARLLFSTPALEGLNFGFILADEGKKQVLDVPRADGTVTTAEMYVNESLWYEEPSLVATFRDIHVEERLRNSLEGTIRIISQMVEFKDSYTCRS